MSDLAQLQAQLDNLRALRAEGVRATRFGNDEVEYRSDAELAAAINAIEGQIAAAQAKPVIRIVGVRNMRGW